ncbi:hypothetical protein BTZ20_0600 [Rhodococcus sp. MTM3W5.2]|nr:hypothetical protein BTZ20_0600 [Rhodococcus sp. MTM3W5.2]
MGGIREFVVQRLLLGATTTVGAESRVGRGLLMSRLLGAKGEAPRRLT